LITFPHAPALVSDVLEDLWLYWTATFIRMSIIATTLEKNVNKVEPIFVVKFDAGQAGSGIAMAFDAFGENTVLIC
jgi:hypothetical protein